LKTAVWAAGLALAVSVRWTAALEPPSTVVSGVSVSSESRKALAVLDEILRSKNDNDPRLDTAFSSLSPETKRLFREKYRGIPPERRNERGTIVFLLGEGNLREADDWAFLREVASEAPCLSLADCAKKPKPGADDAEAKGDEITLAYPSLVALKQAEHVLETASASSKPAIEARRVLAAGRKSSTPAVARMAIKLSKEFVRP
jgi:hypothetical protein